MSCTMSSGIETWYICPGSIHWCGSCLSKSPNTEPQVLILMPRNVSQMNETKLYSTSFKNRACIQTLEVHQNHSKSLPFVFFSDVFWTHLWPRSEHMAKQPAQRILKFFIFQIYHLERTKNHTPFLAQQKGGNRTFWQVDLYSMYRFLPAIVVWNPMQYRPALLSIRR